MRLGWRVGRWVRRGLVGGLLGMVLLFLVVQTGQWVARRRAERVFADVRALELNRSTWADAQRLMTRWGAWGSYEGTCDAQSCKYYISSNGWPESVLVKVRDSLGLSDRVWSAVARLFQFVGGHYTDISTSFIIRNQVVVGVQFTMISSTLPGDSMMSTARSAVQPEKLDFWPEKDPHPEYEMRLRGGTLSYFFTEFTPAAKKEDLEWLTAFDFSCMTRWRPCVNQGDQMPTAWARYVAEQRIHAAARERIGRCDYTLAELVGAAENLVLVEKVDKPGALADGPHAYRLLERMKGGTAWRVGEVREVVTSYYSPRPDVTEEIVMFPTDEKPIFAHDCGVIPATVENLKIVRGLMSESR